MPFLNDFKTRLGALLIKLLVQGTLALGAALSSIQRALAWLDGQHPQLTQWLNALRTWVLRHPKMISSTVASVLMATGAGAFAIANLGPDISDQPVVSVSVPVEVADLAAQALAIEQTELNLTRSDLTRTADTPESLLRRMGVVDPQVAAFLRKNPLAKEALLRSGRTVSAEVNNQKQLRQLSVRWLRNETDTAFQRLVVTRTAQGLQAVQTSAAMNTSVRMTGGTVASSLYAAADEARLPDPVISQLTDIFSSQIDFHRTLRKGARFAVVYEVLEADGEPIRTGRVLSAEFNNDNKLYQAVWFQEPGQKGNYYALDGKSLRRAYLAAPVAFSRKTSGMGMRLHPIFQTLQKHNGVDYAAPTGTPAMSIGDGVVDFAGVQGGYGNVVIVRHSPSHSTVYAHLSRIQVSKGQSIQKGQTIGAVGSTGWSTGPHLHFEFRVNGAHVDPQSVIQQAQATPISPAAMARFNAAVKYAKSQFEAAALMRDTNEL
ncbi:peptidase M23 [Limnohabitans sp. MMS-10A-160]|jgi:murein DD-endopeptidase MepM/ murein hydrolase activator NlpD|uniref:M23 family metallopeptidase n=1 Tax=unclassified Limnohabitans TaxID=2626134 RepID=UPI000D333AF6|nr:MULTISPECIES: M23 family metallopeptidase [unclassified Limnohabitans]PUE19916.1 peptidase M23 [Limnohabitans sp. MMS-10A-192]PUE22828.1 peptidase M23 [Limnohabitans sp. MMS-10A-160]